MKKRDGTELAEEFAEEFAEFRDSGDALILCDYVGKLTDSELSGEHVFISAGREEVDCMLYVVDPKTVDLQRFGQADKILGFPWCNITADPLINSVFVEKESGLKWLVIGLLSDDPIKAFLQAACIRLYDDSPIAIEARAIISTRSNTIVFAGQLDMNFFARSNSGVSLFPLADSYAAVPLTDFGPPLSVTASKVDQRVRVAYEASFQVVATGASGGDCDFILQSSMEDDGSPEVWGNLSGQSAPRILAVGQTDRYTISFTDTLPAGIPDGKELKYRLIAKRTDSDHAVTIHYDGVTALPPSVSISADWLYILGLDLDAGALTVTSATVAAEASVLDGVAEAPVSSVSDVSAEAAAIGGKVEVAISTGAEIAAEATALDDTAEASTESSSVVATEASALGGLSEAVESTSSAVTAEASALDPLWVAPPSSPDAVELGLTPDVIDGTMVTVPARSTGYPNVRFSYHASLSLLAAGTNGGKATLQLQKSEGGGAWGDVTDEYAVIELINQDDETRAAFTLLDAYPTGVPVDTEIQYRLTGKSESALLTVNVHDSLIDPENTDPVCSVEADFFFT